MIIRNDIRNIVAADITSKGMALSSIDPILVSKKIEDSFFKKYKIDIGNMLSGRIYKINTRGELKFAIDDAKESTSNLSDMKVYLRKNYRVEMKSDGKDFLFKHPEEESFTKGSILGKEYEAKNISGYFLDKRKERESTKKDPSIVRKDNAFRGKNGEKKEAKGFSMER